MKREHLLVAAWLPAALALFSGCGRSWPSEESHGPSAMSEQPFPVAVAEPVHESPAQTAQALFTARCAVCHGTIGRGDGPAAVALTPKPRAFADAAWQTAVSDELIYKTIVGGGPATGKSVGMPPNPDLEDKPELVKGLVSIVRAFNKG